MASQNDRRCSTRTTSLMCGKKSLRSDLPVIWKKVSNPVSKSLKRTQPVP